MNKTNVMLSCLIVFCSMFFGDFTTAFKILSILMVIDYITGVIDGLLGVSPKTEQGALNSKIGFKGIVKKFYMLLLIGIGYQLDILLNFNYIKELIIYSFIINELISLLENIGCMGVQYPEALNNIIDILKTKTEKAEGE